MGKTFKKYKGKKYPDKEAKNRKAARSCLNHGGCPYCLSNRIHKYKKRMIVDEED